MQLFVNLAQFLGFAVLRVAAAPRLGPLPLARVDSHLPVARGAPSRGPLPPVRVETLTFFSLTEIPDDH